MTAVLAAIVSWMPMHTEAGRSEMAAQLPLLAPQAVAWARRMETDVLRSGTALDSGFKAIAREVGVAAPERVRILLVDEIPAPDEPLLKAAALRVGLSHASADGMTLGYAILVRRGAETDLRLMSHELRHVAQYEQAGGIERFLAKHLVDLAEHGYEDSPYEVDARAHELIR